MTNRYSKEFREEAVRLVLEGKVSQAQAARDLGVNIWTLRGWVKARMESGREGCPVRPETLEEENRRLKRENAVLKQEREILKKAAAYFAKEHL
jgi:transposase